LGRAPTARFRSSASRGGAFDGRAGSESLFQLGTISLQRLNLPARRLNLLRQFLALDLQLIHLRAPFFVLSLLVIVSLFGGLPCAIEFQQPAGFACRTVFIELAALGLVRCPGSLELIAQLRDIRLERLGADSQAFGFCLPCLKAPFQTVGALIGRLELLTSQGQTLILCRRARNRRLFMLEQLLLAGD
jgi:hypothetical protein